MAIGSLRTALAAAAVACVAGGALAAPITYTFSGTASGTLDGVPFTDAAFTATASGDTANIVQASPGTYCNDLGTVTITIGGVGTVTTTGPNLVFSNTGNEVWGFENGTCAASVTDWLDVNDPASAAYHLDVAIGPSTGTSDGGSTVATSGGDLDLASVPLTFTAVGGAAPLPAAVATPALDARMLGVLILLVAIAAWRFGRRRA
jgi:hypothetical protein